MTINVEKLKQLADRIRDCQWERECSVVASTGLGDFTFTIQKVVNRPYNSERGNAYILYASEKPSSNDVFEAKLFEEHDGFECLRQLYSDVMNGIEDAEDVLGDILSKLPPQATADS